ncbi:hypothetical protein ACQKJZ_01665 [Sphingomonas sp. NPDC019816]|mgnify:CR=1 FL=1|jgi:hypothetical protein|uniref:hypothetical protein n=1 Tax=Sphingomonadales TaxID=204457 RepID=UPI000262C6D4|nr:hypothetical protein [Sphingobium yanoikuyae]MBS0503118.1 hypothetical protein [Pseudomonadota bacterium]
MKSKATPMSRAQNRYLPLAVMKGGAAHKIGIVELDRKGVNIARRLIRHSHRTVVIHRSPKLLADFVRKGAVGATGPIDVRNKFENRRSSG